MPDAILREGPLARFRLAARATHAPGSAGIIARELRAPILPVHIEGTGYVLPDERYWPHFGRVRVAIGGIKNRHERESPHTRRDEIEHKKRRPRQSRHAV